MIPLICTQNYFNTFGFTSCYDRGVLHGVHDRKCCESHGIEQASTSLNRCKLDNFKKKLLQLVLSGIRVSQSILQMEKPCDTSADQDELEEHLLVQASQQYEVTLGPGNGQDGDDDGLDDLLLQASQKYESTVVTEDLAEDNEKNDVVASNEDDDDGLDDVLLQASQKYESMISAKTGDVFPDGPFDAGIQKYNKSRFGNPTTNEDIESVRKSGVPMKTKMSTSWATNVWRSWVKDKLVQMLKRQRKITNYVMILLT